MLEQKSDMARGTRRPPPSLDLMLAITLSLKNLSASENLKKTNVYQLQRNDFEIEKLMTKNYMIFNLKFELFE